MSRVLPDYVPGAAWHIIVNKYGRRGLSGLADEMNCSKMAVIHIFKDGENAALITLVDLADALNIEAERLVEIMVLSSEEVRRQKLVALIGELQDCELEPRLKSYAYSIISGRCGRQPVEKYLPMANALGLTLAELRWILQHS